MRPFAVVGPATVVALFFSAAAATASLSACGGSDGDPVLTKAGSGKGGSSSQGGSGGNGASTGSGRTFAVGGACDGPQQTVFPAGQKVVVDCDIWRGPDAIYRAITAMNACCTSNDRALPVYNQLIPPLQQLYLFQAGLWQQDAERGDIVVNMARVEACEAAVTAALPAIQQCKGDFEFIDLLATCSDLVDGQLAVGTPCADTDSCASPASCQGADDKTQQKGTCQPPSPLGGVCPNGNLSPQFGTDSHPYCAPGGVCSQNECIATIAEGGACKNDNSCATRRCVAGVCTAPLPSKSAVGGVCGTTSDCVSSTRCVGGVCEARLGGGEACTDGSDACGTFCESGKCWGTFCGISHF
jgi:hypothetical protein